MLTILLPTDPTDIYESIDNYDTLKIGQVLDGEDDLELGVLAYYQYAPIVLNDAFRIALAIVHPVGEAIPPREEWYCQQTVLSPFANWRVFMHNGEVLRINEGPSGSVPELEKPFFEYCTDSVFDQAPKLDRASLSRFITQQKPTGLESQRYRKYVNFDSPFKDIYVIELAQSSKVLCAA